MSPEQIEQERETLVRVLENTVAELTRLGGGAEAARVIAALAPPHARESNDTLTSALSRAAQEHCDACRGADPEMRFFGLAEATASMIVAESCRTFSDGPRRMLAAREVAELVMDTATRITGLPWLDIDRWRKQ